MFRALKTFKPFAATATRSFSHHVSRETKSKKVFVVGCTLAISLSLISTFAIQNVSHAESSTLNLEALKKELIDMIDADADKREDGTSMGPTLVRLAWHCSGTYSIKDKNGGSNGATMRLAPEATWGANAGLKKARDFLEPLKKKYNISYADLYTLSGVVAVESMGGPVIKWKPGRSDSQAPTTVPDGRLPSADKGNSSATIIHVREVFNRLGFNDREMVALIGAHALGRCHTDASGYDGPWTRAETTMSNEYFRLLLEEKWTEKKTHHGKPWKGPKQYESKDGVLMMLPADMALVEDSEFKKVVTLYAKDEDAFFKDFADAFSRLLELGVVFPK